MLSNNSTVAALNDGQCDKLTGLYNREAFFEAAAAMLKEHEPGYYIMSCFDINNFKIINDRYGAEEGDRILRHIGRVIGPDVAAVGGISSRIAADNFAALYPAGPNEDFFLVMLRNGSLIPDDVHISLAFSAGRYLVSDLTLPVSAVYDRAYIAKHSVKGRYDEHVAYFDESMLKKLIHEQEISSTMDFALENGQFEVWFQPQFNHTTGALIGAEALVRWRHPQKGLIAPGQFIPVFEQNGFIYELDKYVWEKACFYLRQWLDAGLSPLPVSVNVSRYDIFRDDLLDVINGLVARYQLPVDLLRLEITESAFAGSDSSEQIFEVVKSLMDSGFMLEIDDFGSGYSSLNTLKDVPADVLKLDMRFLENNKNSQRGGNILESVVRMAKWLNMSVIAEGVETIQQADFLKSIGCSYVQGYLYAKPMPAAEYEKLAAQSDKEEHLLTLKTVANLDNDAFWDPQSLETLIFNSFIGGACIYEYYEGKIEMLRANDKYAQVIGSVGMTVETALKLDWVQHLDERNKQIIMAALQWSIANNDEITEEIMFKDLPGCQPRTYLRSTMRVIASAGERHLVYCTNENITEQRKAEAREYQALQQLKLFTDNILGGLAAFIIDDAGLHPVYFNEGFYSFSGYSKEEYREKVACDPLFLVYKEDVHHIQAAIAAVRNGARQITNCTYRCHTKDGGYCWVCMNGLVSERNGAVAAVNVVQFDITERKEAEERLRVSEEEYRLAIQHSGNTIGRYIVAEQVIILAPEVAAANGLSERISGVPYGIIAEGMIAAESCADYLGFFESILQGGRTGKVVYKRKFTDDWRWLTATYSTIFSATGEPVSAVISFAEVSGNRSEQEKGRKIDR